MTLRRLLALACIALSAAGSATPVAAAEFDSDWRGSRPWAGPDCWASPLQDWHVDQGMLTVAAAQDRNVQLTSGHVTDPAAPLQIRVRIRLGSRGTISQPEDVTAGFLLGIQGKLDDPRYRLIHGTPRLRAGVTADGRLFINDTFAAAVPIDVRKDIRLDLSTKPVGDRAEVTLRYEGGTTAVSVTVPQTDLQGNMGLFGVAPRRTPNAGDRPEITWSFADWQIRGDGLAETPEHRFGPILWSQYTLSGRTLKLQAQFPPLGPNDESWATLQIEQNGEWIDAVQAEIDPLSRTALFRIADWAHAGTGVDYRVAYRYQDETHYWQGKVRAEPPSGTALRIAAMSCDNGYLFPNARLVGNVQEQDPDLLFFAGDQIYEGYGGFGVARDAETELAMIDYLRKFYQFGWSWRDLLKNRPSVILPDDHDVFQGNLWGHGGRRLPDNPAGGNNFADGGFLMPVAWVNAVQRTQTGHLPDPADPAPCPSGIDVYFTRMQYGPLDIAILEDRKWKTGPASVPQLNEARRSGDAAAAAVESAELLGQRQESFLQGWAGERVEGRTKVVLSQTIFCKAHTHAGRDLKPSVLDFDTNAWPQPARNRALRILAAASPLMIHGDQHLGVLLRHGIQQHGDGPVAFMVPGTANGFPRAWWPVPPQGDTAPAPSTWTGNFTDDFGHPITVLAAGNPDPGSNQLRDINPEQIGHRKGSGHGIVDVHPDGTAIFNLYRLLFDAANPTPDDQFPGFPQTVPLRAATAR